MTGNDWTPGTAALDLACPFCDAHAGFPCVTASGRRAPVHMDRMQPLLDAFAAGYEDGRAEQRRIDEIRGGVR